METVNSVLVPILVFASLIAPLIYVTVRDRRRNMQNHSRGPARAGSPYSARPRRETIPKSVKMYVWQRDGGRCVECGSNEKLEYDHIIPFSKGGSNTDRNLQLLCERCNRFKGAKIGG